MQQEEIFCHWPGLKNYKNTELPRVHKASGNFYCANPHCCCLYWRWLHLLPPHDSCSTSMVMPGLRQKMDSVLRDAWWHGRRLITLSLHKQRKPPNSPCTEKIQETCLPRQRKKTAQLSPHWENPGNNTRYDHEREAPKQGSVKHTEKPISHWVLIVVTSRTRHIALNSHLRNRADFLPYMHTSVNMTKTS